jgi:hypothetical protein
VTTGSLTSMELDLHSREVFIFEVLLNDQQPGRRFIQNSFKNVLLTVNVAKDFLVFKKLEK